ncbi:MAG: hypothetical protein IJU87_07815, partial [Lachnospiraceae bacterium]|nr:hypothetical protein [Lachnospiraceae bacterium]
RGLQNPGASAGAKENGIRRFLKSQSARNIIEDDRGKINNSRSKNRDKNPYKNHIQKMIY